MPHKSASSQAAWALLTEGVTGARVEVHRLRHLVTRASKIVGQSEHKEHIQQIAGDILQGIPERLSRLEIGLDRTALALSKMGPEFLEARLPLSEKNLVDEAIKPDFGGKMHISDKVARLYLRAGFENGKLDPSVRQAVNAALDRQGLTGARRFPKIGRAFITIAEVLAVYGIEFDEVLNAHRTSQPTGTWPMDVAFTNPTDLFSPVSIRNSVLHFQWTDLGTKTPSYEVVAYLS